jgi:hypothetical protein
MGGAGKSQWAFLGSGNNTSCSIASTMLMETCQMKIHQEHSNDYLRRNVLIPYTFPSLDPLCFYLNFFIISQVNRLKMGYAECRPKINAWFMQQFLVRVSPGKILHSTFHLSPAVF